MTKDITYTVSGDNILVQGLSLTDAAAELLWHNGHEYELRAEEGGWQLYVSTYSSNAYGGNGGLHRAYSHERLIFADTSNKEDAWPILALQVINADWPNCPSVYSDEAYAKIIAEEQGDDK